MEKILGIALWKIYPVTLIHSQKNDTPNLQGDFFCDWCEDFSQC